MGLMPATNGVLLQAGSSSLLSQPSLCLGDEDTDIECKLCFQSLDSAGQQPQLACTRESCSQPFHEECLQKWFRSNIGKYSDSCPLCTKCIRDIDNEPFADNQDPPIKLHMRKISKSPVDNKLYAEIDPACVPLADPQVPPEERRTQRRNAALMREHLLLQANPELQQVHERVMRYSTDPAYRHQRDRELRRALPSTIPLLLMQSTATYLRGLNLLRKAGEDSASVTVVELQENLEEAAEGHVRLEARLNRMMEELQLGGVPTDETEQERLLEQIEHMGNLMDSLRDLEVRLDLQLQRAIQQQGAERRDVLVEMDSNAAQLQGDSQV